MRVFGFDFDQGLAERRRVVIKIGRLRIERSERVESRRAEAEHVKRIEHDDIAYGAAIVGGDGGQLALRIDHDDGAVIDAQQVRNQEARTVAGPVRPEQQEVPLASIGNLVADARRRFVKIAPG
jgi:hypothetical protein